MGLLHESTVATGAERGFRVFDWPKSRATEKRSHRRHSSFTTDKQMARNHKRTRSKQLGIHHLVVQKKTQEKRQQQQQQLIQQVDSIHESFHNHSLTDKQTNKGDQESKLIDNGCRNLYYSRHSQAFAPLHVSASSFQVTTTTMRRPYRRADSDSGSSCSIASSSITSSFSSSVRSRAPFHRSATATAPRPPSEPFHECHVSRASQPQCHRQQRGSSRCQIVRMGCLGGLTRCQCPCHLV